MLTNFAKSSFNTIIEISLWISLIVFIIGGWNFGKTLNIPAIVGAVFGVLTFVITILPMYGLIAICINMDKNIENINENIVLLYDKITPQENSSNKASSSNESNSSSKGNFIDQISSSKESKAPW